MGRWVAVVVLAGVGLAHVAPYGLGLEQGVHILVFVGPNCPACEALRGELNGISTIYVGSSPAIAYRPYRLDPERLLHLTFRINNYPTLVLLKDGQEVRRYEPPVRGQEVKRAYQEAKSGRTEPPYSYKIHVGDRVGGEFDTYTGLLIFWRESCPSCREEAPAIRRLCHSGSLSVRVLATQGEALPRGCPGKYARGIALSWGIPGVPAMVYLREGRVTWLDLGYRESQNFNAVIEALVKTGGDMR